MTDSKANQVSDHPPDDQDDTDASLLNFVMMIGTLALLLISVVWMLMRPDNDSERIEFAKTLVQITGGAVLLVGLWFTHRTVKLSSESNRRANRQLTMELDSKDEDRFYTASEKLGHDNEAVRIAGLYSLERFLSSRPDYRHQAINVLCAFVRWRSAVVRSKLIVKEQEERDLSQLRVVEDISIALGIINSQSIGEEPRPKNLRGAYLVGVHFVGADFSFSDFSESLMAHTVFLGCRMSGVKFNDSTMKLTVFKDSSLSIAFFSGASISNTQFEFSDGESSPDQVDFYPPVSSTEGLSNTFWYNVSFDDSVFRCDDLSGMRGLTASQFRSFYKHKDAKFPQIRSDDRTRVVDLGDDIGLVVGRIS